MKALPKVLIGLAVICVVAGLVIKIVVNGVVIPAGSWPWLKMAGLALLFAIAITLAEK